MMHAFQLLYCAAAALLFRQLTDVRQEIQVLREEPKSPELEVQQALAQQVLALKTEQDQQRTQLQTLQEKLDDWTRGKAAMQLKLDDVTRETASSQAETASMQLKLDDVTREMTNCLAETADLYGVTTILQQKMTTFEQKLK